MSILKFSVPSDTKIHHDINLSKKFNFIDSGSILQNLRETVYVRKFKFYNEQNIQKVIYKKEGVDWIFSKLELVNF